MDQDVRRRVDTAIRNLGDMTQTLKELNRHLSRVADSLERLTPPPTTPEEPRLSADTSWVTQAKLSDDPYKENNAQS